ncbi:MAG: Fe-S cluster assembly protein SufD [Saprospiraceae bacterium]
MSTPIHCLYITTSTGQAHHCHPQHFVKAAAGSQLTILESFHDLEEATPSFINAATHIEVAANAHLHYYRLQGAGRESLVVNNTIVRQHRDSVFSHYALDLGGKVVRNNLAATHLDSNLETHYYGVYFGNGNQHIDNQTFIDHAMPHCQSNELYKGIMTDYARGVFNGKVTVRQDAQKTNAFQQNSSLVLSANAIMDTKPQLEIFADDVRCSHGATVGQLDESSVFYLRSRGLSPANARRLLQEAFLGEVVDNMPHEAIRTYAHQLITDKFA